jgi:hypothetical protein
MKTRESKMKNRKVSDSKVEVLDDETLLIVAICRDSFNLEGDNHLSDMGYLKKYENYIRTAGRVLEVLGLAMPVEGRVICWKPTRRLISLFAEPGTRVLPPTKRWASNIELALLELLFEAADANADDNSGGAGFACHVLERLALLREDGSGDLMPTPRLAELVAKVREEKFLAWTPPSGIFVPKMRTS